MKAARARGLRRGMLLQLMLPLLAIVGLAGIVGVFTAQRLTDDVFDRWLLDAARSLAGQVRFVDQRLELELPAVAQALLAYDETDSVSYGVEQNGQTFFGRPHIPRSGARETRYPNGRAFDATYEGRAVRVAVVEVSDGHGGQATVLMAETTLKRQQAQQEILAMLAPLGLLLVAAALAIELAVRRTLRPLQSIAARWNEHSHLSLQAIAADDVPRELIPFAAALNDLLARIRAMLQREREFTATLAHQFRTPLAGIRLGLARAMQAPDLPGVRKVLTEVDRSTQRTVRLIQQLLAIERLGPEVRGDLALVTADLGALAHDVGAAYLEFALDKRIDLELRVPKEPVVAVVQSDLLAEALGNLLDNALRYTPQGGQILIEVENAPPAIHISDSGPGVPAQERDTVFQRLVRGSSALGEGSGLGLAIVRDIATLHNATVTLGRSELGGAIFSIRFGSH